MRLELVSRVPERVDQETPILFVHGAWHGAWCWEPHFMPYFAAKGYRVYAVSLRGHGGSDGKEMLRWHRIKNYVEDLAIAIDRLPRPPVLVGHSLGGHVVQKYLESNRCPASVLMASVPAGGIVKMLERLVSKHPLLFLEVNTFLSLYPFVGTPRMAKEMLFSADTPDAAIQKYYEQLQDESYLSFLDMLFMSPIRPHRVRSPVLVMGAANDNVFYRRDMRKTARAYHHKAIILPNMAHDMMLENDWQRAADVILWWLKGRGLYVPRKSEPALEDERDAPRVATTIEIPGSGRRFVHRG